MLTEVSYGSLEEMIANVAEMVQPRELLSTSEAAAKYRKLNNPGSYTGPWDNDKAPYLVEFMDTLDSLEFRGNILVAPARTGKTDALLNWIAKTAKCDPTDMMVVQMTQAAARDWSSRDLKRLFRHSKEIGDLLLPGRQNDNVGDKTFRSGMQLLIKWPSITELSGKTIPRLWLPDLDRMPDDIDGEGPPFDLAMKRAESFKRFGMCVAESSPGREIEDAKWQPNPKFPHEAPPVKGGILSLYNRGDRRRRYWRCMQCAKPFEPDFSLLDYPKSDDHMEAAEQVTLVCPHCGFPHEPSMKKELDLNGKWIKEGQHWMPDGSVKGTARRTDIASFWLKGPVALFQDWKSLVFNYLQAMETFETTQDEGPLRKTVNTDQGLPYTPFSIKSDRLPEALKQRAQDFGTAEAPTVPEGVRFLIATVDVQAGSNAAFVVQVQGFGEDGDGAIIDTFKIRKSARIDADGERCLIDPAAYKEDWQLLVPQVMEKTYLLADGSGRRMSIKMTGCDSGGAEGVTANAYDFYRWLRQKHEQSFSSRFFLLKGEPSKNAPRFRIGLPDSQQKDPFAIARGDVPVIFLNSLLLKDQIAAMLSRDTEGGGKISFAKWIPDWIYTQLTSEVRTPKGWENPRRRRNEAWDLLYYAVGICLHPAIARERIDWDNPPGWAQVWDRNDLVFREQNGVRMNEKPAKAEVSLADLGREMA